MSYTRSYSSAVGDLRSARARLWSVWCGGGRATFYSVVCAALLTAAGVRTVPGERRNGGVFFVRRVCSLISPSLYVDRSFLIAAERGCRRAETARTKSQSERKISCAAVVVVVEMRFGSELITRRNAVQIFFCVKLFRTSDMSAMKYRQEMFHLSYTNITLRRRLEKSGIEHCNVVNQSISLIATLRPESRIANDMQLK